MFASNVFWQDVVWTSVEQMCLEQWRLLVFQFVYLFIRPQCTTQHRLVWMNKLTNYIKYKQGVCFKIAVNQKGILSLDWSSNHHAKVQCPGRPLLHSLSQVLSIESQTTRGKVNIQLLSWGSAPCDFQLYFETSSPVTCLYCWFNSLPQYVSDLYYYLCHTVVHQFCVGVVSSLYNLVCSSSCLFGAWWHSGPVSHRILTSICMDFVLPQASSHSPKAYRWGSFVTLNCLSVSDHPYMWALHYPALVQCQMGLAPNPHTALFT